MPAPRGTRAQAFKLTSGAQVHVYSDDRRVVLQLRQAVPTEADVLVPSFKVAVELNAREIMAVTGELLAAAARLTSEPGQGDGHGRLDDRRDGKGKMRQEVLPPGADSE